MNLLTQLLLVLHARVQDPDDPDNAWCAHCADGWDGEDYELVKWPCPTIRIVEELG